MTGMLPWCLRVHGIATATELYEGTARYTNEIGASVEFTFVGTAIRWYGQNDVNFGAAEVYVDGVLAGEVNVYGPAAAQQLLFEADGLAYGKHTIASSVCLRWLTSTIFRMWENKAILAGDFQHKGL